ncbi:MAG: hypothetical protein KF881_07505 [Acidobacteria bacterium]|nr:hypothetical protein [Acidobacteriota bacterium]
MGDSTEETFKILLSRWAIALSRNREDGQRLFFPFLPDDEWTTALKGVIDGDSLKLSLVTLGIPGYGINFEKVEDFIVSPIGLFSNSNYSVQIFEGEETVSLDLSVKTEEFIEELKNARIKSCDRRNEEP